MKSAAQVIVRRREWCHPLIVLPLSDPDLQDSRSPPHAVWPRFPPSLISLPGLRCQNQEHRHFSPEAPQDPDRRKEVPGSFSPVLTQLDPDLPGRHTKPNQAFAHTNPPSSNFETRNAYRHPTHQTTSRAMEIPLFVVPGFTATDESGAPEHATEKACPRQCA